VKNIARRKYFNDDETPTGYFEHVIEYVKQFVDREELRANLKLTVTERLEKHDRRMREEMERRKQQELAQDAESDIECIYVMRNSNVDGDQ
jgi:hypothetical protein